METRKKLAAAAPARRASASPSSARRGSWCSRSNLHIYAQIIAPDGDRVLASASTLEEDVRKDVQERRQQGRGGDRRQAHRREGEGARHRERSRSTAPVSGSTAA